MDELDTVFNGTVTAHKKMRWEGGRRWTKENFDSTKSKSNYPDTNIK